MARFVIAVIILLVAPVTGRAQPTKPSPPSRLTLVQAQCAGHCTCGADADCGATGTCASGVCTAGDAGRTACNVDADCAATRTCMPAPGPCAPAYRVGGGTLMLRSAKQPAPTRDPSQNNAGQMTLTGVTLNGAAFSGTLNGEVVLKTTFGTDANGNCALNLLQISTPSELGPLACRNGKCKGRLLQFAALPKTCADVTITSEFVAANVRDGNGALVATAGLVIPAGKSDAP